MGNNSSEGSMSKINVFELSKVTKESRNRNLLEIIDAQIQVLQMLQLKQRSMNVTGQTRTVVSLSLKA